MAFEPSILLMLRLILKRFLNWFESLRQPKRYTLGFRPDLLAPHFSDHQAEFPDVTTEAEYEARADRFLSKPLDRDTLECYRTRPDGTRGAKVRYNTRTQEYGILRQDNYILSYYIAGRAGPSNPRGHRFTTNVDYFRWDCARIKWWTPCIPVLFVVTINYNIRLMTITSVLVVVLSLDIQTQTQRTMFYLKNGLCGARSGIVKCFLRHPIGALLSK